MLLFVLDHEGASAVRVEVGYGLEGVVSGRVAADAVDAMAAARDDALDAGWSREEALEFALLTGSGFLLDTLDASYVDGRFPEPDPYAEGPPASFVLLVVVLVFVLVALLASTVEAHGRRSGWGYRSSRSSWESGLGGAFAGALIRGALGGGPRRPGGGFGGGGFGGGGSFGGGRSGGGGGSGRL